VRRRRRVVRDDDEEEDRDDDDDESGRAYIRVPPVDETPSVNVVDRKLQA
jgi:hypothetical protein